MTTETLTLTGFLLARIAEDEAAPDCEGYGEYVSCRDWSDRRAAECEAKRRIVDLHRSSAAWPGGGPEAVAHYAGFEEAVDFVLRKLAQPYADHPDFREEWRA